MKRRWDCSWNRSLSAGESRVDIASLRDYEKWVDQPVAKVLGAAKAAGGWINVFPVHLYPSGLPKWAHRIRNYFNLEPRLLLRLDPITTRAQMAGIKSGLDNLDQKKLIKFMKKHPFYRSVPEVQNWPEPPPGTPDLSIVENIKEDRALSGHAYSDSNGQFWYQMSIGGTIYHWGSDPKIPSLEAFGTTVTRSQATVPVFKLVAPDGTGGSCETIVKNPYTQSVEIFGRKYKIGRFAIGQVGIPELVSDSLISDVWLQGSYNYSETVVVGGAAHDHRDVKTHTRFHNDKRIYVNPVNRWTPLSARVFPRTAPGESEPLAKQQV